MQVQASCPLMLTDNIPARIVIFFRKMYNYTVLVFRHRVMVFCPSVICLYARRGGGGGENGKFRTTRKPSFSRSRWSLES